WPSDIHGAPRRPSSTGRCSIMRRVPRRTPPSSLSRNLPSPMLPVVILCGGFGTRLRPAVGDRPKVLAPVAGRPFLDHLLTHLARQGCTDVVLSTGYLGEMVEAFAGDGASWGIGLRYAREPEPLGTGGA